MANKFAKEDIKNHVVKRTGVSGDVVRFVIDETLEAITEAVSTGHTIEIRGFGTFRPILRKAKTARNLAKGETIHIPARYKPHFKPCKSFIEKTKQYGDLQEVAKNPK